MLINPTNTTQQFNATHAIWNWAGWGIELICYYNSVPIIKHDKLDFKHLLTDTPNAIKLSEYFDILEIVFVCMFHWEKTAMVVVGPKTFSHSNIENILTFKYWKHSHTQILKTFAHSTDIELTLLFVSFIYPISVRNVCVWVCVCVYLIWKTFEKCQCYRFNFEKPWKVSVLSI